MFIKLSFTTNTRITIPLRILADIINNQSVNSVSSLQARFTSASYAATLTSNFDATNSLIVRTNVALNTKAHFVHNYLSTVYNTSGDFVFTLEQPVYDSILNNKVYTQLRTNTGTGNTQSVWQDHGQLITGGTMDSTQMLVSVPESYSTTASSGTPLLLGGNNFGTSTGNYFLSASAGFNDVRTFWCYITDKCFFWCVSTGTGAGLTYPAGFPPIGNFSNAGYFNGVYFQSQYTRYDYHNNEVNGIWPVAYNAQRTGSSYGGMWNTTDVSTTQNINYTGVTQQPLRVMGMISALPQVGANWPKIYNPYVYHTFKGVSSSNYGLSQTQIQGSVSTQAAPTYAGAFTTITNARHPNSTLQTSGFGMMPFGWENTYYGNHGGNITDQSGVYMFNGEFAPGDTFVYNNITYMIWPRFMANDSYRLGICIPIV